MDFPVILKKVDLSQITLQKHAITNTTHYLIQINIITKALSEYRNFNEVINSKTRCSHMDRVAQVVEQCILETQMSWVRVSSHFIS